MATGPEHMHEAERLLRSLAKPDGNYAADAQLIVANAQAHATMAVASWLAAEKERQVFTVAVGHDLDGDDAERIQRAVAEALRRGDA